MNFGSLYCAAVHMQIGGLYCVVHMCLYIMIHCDLILCSLAEAHGKREVRKVPSAGGLEDTARRHIASELLQTEKNFVDILNIIVKVGILKLYVPNG